MNLPFKAIDLWNRTDSWELFFKPDFMQLGDSKMMTNESMVPDIWLELKLWRNLQVFAFNAAISACEKSGEWQQVSEILG